MSAKARLHRLEQAHGGGGQIRLFVRRPGEKPTAVQDRLATEICEGRISPADTLVTIDEIDLGVL